MALNKGRDKNLVWIPDLCLQPGNPEYGNWTAEEKRQIIVDHVTEAVTHYKYDICDYLLLIFESSVPSFCFKCASNFHLFQLSQQWSTKLSMRKVYEAPSWWSTLYFWDLLVQWVMHDYKGGVELASAWKFIVKTQETPRINSIMT